MILVFGSLNVDLAFSVAALPAPGQTLAAQALRIEPGGKGANQAYAARRAGAEVAMVGAVGRDPLADVALANLRAVGVDVAGVAALDAPTGCASILTDAKGTNQIIVALGANALAHEGQVSDALLARAEFLLLQGESDADAIETLISRAVRAGTRVLLNLAPAVRLSDAALHSVDLLVVNESEAAALAKWLGCKPSAASLFATLGIETIRTLGAKGSEAATLDGVFSIDAEKITPVDTTGAGDAYVGALAASFARGEPLVLAMRAGTKAAGECCMRRGAQG